MQLELTGRRAAQPHRLKAATIRTAQTKRSKAATTEIFSRLDKGFPVRGARAMFNHNGWSILVIYQ